MAQIALQQTLIHKILDRDVAQFHPTALFRLCQTDASLYEICQTYRSYIWQSYFENDILSYMYDPSKHSPHYPNYENDLQFRSQWNELNEKLAQDSTQISNQQIYAIYQMGLKQLISTAWYLAEKLRPGFRSSMPLIQSQWMQNVGLEDLSDPSATLKDLTMFTSARIENICRLKKRLQLASTTLHSQAESVLLTVQVRQVLRYVEFAAASGNAALLNEIVTAWPEWFYTIYDDGKKQVDVLALLIETIANVIDNHEVSNEQATELARTFTKLFVIPTTINPRGRFSTKYSKEVKEMLQPIKDQADEFQDYWHQAAESMWIDELDTKF